jgi:small subunit ribosomal protein S3
MGQKVNSLGLRLGINKDWDSKWYVGKNYNKVLHQDFNIRDFLGRTIEKENLIVRKCVIKHSVNKTFVFLHTYGTESDSLKVKLPIIEKVLTRLTGHEVVLNHLNLIVVNSIYKKIINKVSTELSSFKTRKYFTYGLEVLNAVTLSGSATLLTTFIANELTKNQRHSQFLDFVKKAIPTFMAIRPNIKGVRIQVAGRLNGSERKKIDWFREGQIPLHSLKSKVDYSSSTAFTIYGTCGVKVWICSK